MTNHLLRLYAAVVALLVFFLTWMVIAAHPWRAKPKAQRDPRLVALANREQHLEHDALVVRRVVKRRWTVYRRDLKKRLAEIAAVRRRHEQQVAAARAAAARAAAIAAARQADLASAPAAGAAPASSSRPVRVVVLPPKVQVVKLPPITITRSS